MLSGVKAGVIFAVAVSFCILTASCDDQETKEQAQPAQEYFRQVAAAFQQADDDAESVELAPEGTAFPREELLDRFRDYYRRYLEVVRNLRADLELIDPPVQLEDEHREALEEIDQLIDTVEDLRGRADEADPSAIPDAELLSGTLEISYRIREACDELLQVSEGFDAFLDSPCDQAAGTQANDTLDCETFSSGVSCCGVIAPPGSEATPAASCPPR